MGGTSFTPRFISLHVKGFEIIPAIVLGDVTGFANSTIYVRSTGFEHGEVVGGRTLGSRAALNPQVLATIVVEYHHILSHGLRVVYQPGHGVSKHGLDATTNIIGREGYGAGGSYGGEVRVADAVGADGFPDFVFQ